MSSTDNQQWKRDLLACPTFQLSELEIQLLKEGPKSLAQAWHLQALRYKYLTKWSKIT